MKRGKIFIGIGIALLAASLGLGLYNLRAERFAASSAAQAYSQLQLQLPAKDVQKPVRDLIEIPDYIINPEMDMPTSKVNGRNYIGTLEIPSLELSLPIMSQWSYEDLNIAPGRYTGSVYSHDLVIAAHNYASHFGSLRELMQGEILTFTDVDGNVFSYEVLGLEILGPNDTAYMTTGPWDMTLFTCTVDGAQRVTVRCALKSDTPNTITKSS